MDHDTSRSDARRAPRDRVIRRVQLVADGRAVDGIMLDVSRCGARVQVGGPDSLPAEFYLRAADGTVQRVARRWAQDRQMGLEFMGEADEGALPLPAPQRADPREIREALRTVPIQETLSLLARSGHFGDEALRTASRDLIAALDRVDDALQGLAAERRQA